MTPEQKIREAIAEVDMLALAVTNAEDAVRVAHAALVKELSRARTDIARIRRELTEIDADRTPVRAPSGAAALSARAMVEGFELRKRSR